MPMSDLATKLAALTALSPSRCAEVIDTVFALILQSTDDGEVVAISGFGSFRQEIIPDRLDHHPSTGAGILMRGSRFITFNGEVTLVQSARDSLQISRIGQPLRNPINRLRGDAA